MSSVNENPAGKTAHRAGAFDIRIFIASLIGIYGLVLIVVGLVGTDATQMAKANGLNINLYAGIGMAVAAALFVLWARLRPVVVAEEVDEKGTAGENGPAAD
ncbi:MAG: hypothetical protein M3393_07720 [Actinomycetota bacterium]|jgi:hypothetical protein|nr:hypothetical protein [Actinomycetota bacterium]